MAHLRSNARTAACIASGDQTRHMVPMREQPDAVARNDGSGGLKMLCHPETAWLGAFYNCKRVELLRCPWQVGQVLWLREPARVLDVRGRSALSREVLVEWPSNGLRAWRQWPARLGRDPIKDRGISNGCLREFARYGCEVKSVGAQRFKEITIQEATQEGVTREQHTNGPREPIYALQALLESIYGEPLPEWWWWCAFETRRI